jgi:hypothetical protein
MCETRLKPLSVIHYLCKQSNTEIEIDRIAVNTDFDINTVFYVDDQILLAKCDDYLQCFVYSLNNMPAEFSMEINTEKETKIMACRGTEAIRSQICISMMEVFQYKNSALLLA